MTSLKTGLFLAVSLLFLTSYTPDTEQYTVIASAYNSGSRTACGTKPKDEYIVIKANKKLADNLAFINDSEELDNNKWKVHTITVAITHQFRKRHSFKNGDVFYCPEHFPNTIILYEDVMPSMWNGKRDIDLFLRKGTKKWGVKEIIIYKIGHLDHPKFNAREKFLKGR